jgi:hypothetical protein
MNMEMLKKVFVPLLMEYNRLRDEEWDFEDKHGNRDMWDDEVNKEHDELLDKIMEKRREVENYLRIITENPDLKF